MVEASPIVLKITAIQEYICSIVKQLQDANDIVKIYDERPSYMLPWELSSKQ